MQEGDNPLDFLLGRKTEPAPTEEEKGEVARKREDVRERRVLELRYLHGLQETELCRRMNLSAAQLWRVHGAALEHFRAVYEREQKGM